MDTANDQHIQNADSRSPAISVRGSARLDGRSGLHFDAAIFDMDGVVTDTTAVHSRVWKQMFDSYLRRRATALAVPFVEFDAERDYRAFVDGRPRYEGVATFLNSRGISLSRGVPSDSSQIETVCGLGNLKNEIFNSLIKSEGVATFESTVSLIRQLLQEGVKIGLATSSFNAAGILQRSGADKLFESVVDGAVAASRKLKGKPEPDVFVAAAADLGVPASRAIVIEDAVPGVQAGAKGGFALVIGIARDGKLHELLRIGADIAVRDLSETSLEQIEQLVQEKRARAG